MTATTPSDSSELVELVRSCNAESKSATVVGSSTKSSWGSPLGEVDVVISTARMSGILDHAVADQTVAVRAGTRLAEIQAALAPHGQRIALDPPDPAGLATVGGVVAAGDAGPAQFRYGGPRDLVIGASFVLANGMAAKSGGRVIKNVAGLDLQKLLCGSLGTLAVLTEVIFRLHPLPEAGATIHAQATASEATAAVLALASCQSEPAAIEWSDGDLLVKMSGTEAGLAARIARAQATIATATGLDSDVLGESEAAKWWAGLEALRGGGDDAVVLRATSRLDGLAGVAQAVAAAAERAGVASHLASHAGSGLHDIVIQGAPAAQAGGVNALRAALAPMGVSVVVRHRPGGPGGATLDGSSIWGPPPPAVSTMAAVKAALDPNRILSAGRFSPWW